MNPRKVFLHNLPLVISKEKLCDYNKNPSEFNNICPIVKLNQSHYNQVHKNYYEI